MHHLKNSRHNLYVRYCISGLECLPCTHVLIWSDMIRESALCVDLSTGIVKGTKHSKTSFPEEGLDQPSFYSLLLLLLSTLFLTGKRRFQSWGEAFQGSRLKSDTGRFLLEQALHKLT